MSKHRLGNRDNPTLERKEGVPEDLRRVEVITGVGRRRRWSAEAKARIVLESQQPGAVVSEVARQHGLTPQQLFGVATRVSQRPGRRRCAQGRRSEKINRGRSVPRHRQDHPRRRQPTRLPRRQVGEISAQVLLLFLRCDTFCSALQELEDVLHHIAARSGGLDPAAHVLPHDLGAEHQARSLRTSRRS